MIYYKDLLTIGIHAYNEGKYLRRTIESCVNQAGKVLVSDNASTDNTQEICEELAKKYPNLIYRRHKENIGATANYLSNVEAAKTKYFMMLGAHDYLDDSYTKHMLHILENSDAAGCYPNYRQVDIAGEEIGLYQCWFADRLVSDSPSKRVYALISHLHEVSALFGIFRTDLVKKHPIKSMIGNDHVFVCNMALEGRLIHSPYSIYNWRQTKMGLSDAENLAIWEKTLGNSENKIAISRKEMRDEQINILKKAGFKSIGFFEKLLLISKAKKKLKKRFGNN